jgi:serine protease AprX
MDLVARLTVSIERIGFRHRSRIAACALAAASALAAAPAQAGELAKELVDVIKAPKAPAVKWAHEVSGRRFVQALVLSDSPDPNMTDLRAFVVGAGGAVLRIHAATHALTVNVPTSVLNELARLDDVVSVAPNRTTHHTASTLETITGTLTSNVRTNSTKSSYSGLDGTGIGIAIVDSGVMKGHNAFLNGLGITRVKRNVSMLHQTLANWTTGVDSTTSPMPGSLAEIQYESSIANDGGTDQDPFGHGTHVASVAAGRAKYYASTTPDTTGIAPNANIYDVQVLDGNGSGTISEAIEGIEWVIYHAKQYNIRVMNLSLAASSTQTWQTDPLCAAARSATAAGITVVVSASRLPARRSTGRSARPATTRR